MHRAMVPPTLIARSARFAAVCLIVVFAETAHAQVPTINIQETCRAAAGVMVDLMGGSTSQNDVQICLESEDKARQQLLKDWSTFQASDREGCIQANVYLPSYIEWLTCFEMNKSVREGRKQGRAISGITNRDGSVTLPSVGSLGIMMGTTRQSYAQSKNAPKRDQGTVRSAAIKAAETSWNKLPTNELACVNQELTARGDSVPSLAKRGVLPSDDRVADIRAQCVSPSSPAPSPIAAQAAQQSPQQQPSSPPQQQPSSDEQARQQEASTNPNQPVERLKTDLAASTARVAVLEKGKAAAESALKQAEQARSDAQKAQHETDQARNADKAKLDAATAQFEAYKASADTNTDWRWAYAGIGGLIGLIAGLTPFLFTRWRRVGLRLHTQ
jgi:ElaB/YqjD/DUF883 family membrane-anchored ribosome-binding protein